MTTLNGHRDLVSAEAKKASALMITEPGLAQIVVEKAIASINDVLQTTASQVGRAVSELKETIKGCEAKISADEEIQVIVNPNQLIFNIKRRFEFLKDK